MAMLSTSIPAVDTPLRIRPLTLFCAMIQSIDCLVDWLKKEQTCPKLVYFIKCYPLSCGDIIMLYLSAAMALFTQLWLLHKILLALETLRKEGHTFSTSALPREH